MGRAREAFESDLSASGGFLRSARRQRFWSRTPVPEAGSGLLASTTPSIASYT